MSPSWTLLEASGEVKLEFWGLCPVVHVGHEPGKGGYSTSTCNRELMQDSLDMLNKTYLISAVMRTRKHISQDNTSG